MAYKSPKFIKTDWRTKKTNVWSPVHGAFDGEVPNELLVARERGDREIRGMIWKAVNHRAISLMLAFLFIFFLFKLGGVI
ncbi:unnamed protein product [Linum trigynum]|uniref:Uncharacterized protein n=1 Tax=Linum trigynum TaxID=586398 RepID=A0AAV2FRM1_9ROSI